MSSVTTKPTHGSSRRFSFFKDIFFSLCGLIGATATALSLFASDTAHFCVRLYNICGEAIVRPYGEEQSF